MGAVNGSFWLPEPKLEGAAACTPISLPVAWASPGRSPRIVAVGELEKNWAPCSCWETFPLGSVSRD